MDNKTRIRLIIGIAAIFAATLIIGLSTGIVNYWIKGIGYYIEEGYTANVSVYIADDELFATQGSPCETELGSITIRSYAYSDGVTTITLEFKSKLSYGGAKVLSAKPLTGRKDYLMELSVDGERLAFTSQSYDKSAVTAVYTFDGEIDEDAKFYFTGIVMNEFVR